jgi:D-alanyl-lipoteichoic acid acyltransferase DltB (MBOAT superfamily)
MPNIYISHRRIRIELISLAVCFLIATALNVYAIIHYNSPLSELWTSILYVLMATAVLYAVWIVLRLLVFGIARLFGYKPKRRHRYHYHHK